MISITPLAFLLQGTALGLTAAASPGPFQAYLISQSLTGGWRRGAPAAFAPLITDAPIILLVLIVLRQLPPIVIRGLSLTGGLFVLYLARGSWRQWRASADPATEIDNTQARTISSLRGGVMMNFLSPGPYLFWSLVNGPILISALDESAWHGAAFVIGFYSVMIGSLLALVALFHQARRLGPRIVRGLVLVSIVILVAFGGLLFGQSLIG